MPDQEQTTDEQGTPEAQAPAAAPTSATPEAAAAAAETVTREEHLREVDRYRNQFGQEQKRAAEAEKRLKALEDANKSETERLTEKAQKADTLETTVATLTEQRDAYAAALAAEVSRQEKALPDNLRALYKALPESLSPVDQLAWLGEATKEAAKAQKQGNGLPPAGGRTGAVGAGSEPTEAQRATDARRYANRF